MATEQTIASRLARKIAARGYLTSVWEGEAYAIKFESDPAKVIRELGSTDMDRLVIRDSNKQRIGTILLIWGNGEDLISDYSWSTEYPDAERIIGELAE